MCSFWNCENIRFVTQKREEVLEYKILVQLSKSFHCKILVALEVSHTGLYALLFEMWFILNLLQKSLSFSYILDFLCEYIAGLTLIFLRLGSFRYSYQLAFTLLCFIFSWTIKKLSIFKLFWPPKVAILHGSTP